MLKRYSHDPYYVAPITVKVPSQPSYHAYILREAKARHALTKLEKDFQQQCFRVTADLMGIDLRIPQ